LGRAASASEPEASELPVWLTTRREPRLRPASAVVTPFAPGGRTEKRGHQRRQPLRRWRSLCDPFDENPPDARENNPLLPVK
jgi:hypothetical protein